MSRQLNIRIIVLFVLLLEGSGCLNSPSTNRFVTSHPPGAYVFQNLDFGFDGSFYLVYSHDSKEYYCIKIVCPDDPATVAKPVIEHGIGVDYESIVYKEMSKEDLSHFVIERLNVIEDPGGKLESDALAVLATHAGEVACIRNWGFGVGLIDQGKWYKVFSIPSADTSKYK
ncbi:hypothetical protein VN12_18360 [Pirellula sp. SH-Sr6A]|uniref:hypothetical protein n=1 Tax=Pirellula sp. SH-Sr6A TaxID=1632865 RepID=UPI00078D8A76|nr:hypothetical protein [Pirellula sp. SH-Sr6A]AMV34099.1 hypothetical protein VN12_18360 [Pirellula sp. SH-Sr6A]